MRNLDKALRVVSFAGVMLAFSVAACSSTSDDSSPATADAGSSPPPQPDAGRQDSPHVDDAAAPDGAVTPAAATTGTGTYATNLGDFVMNVDDVMATYKTKPVTAGFESELKIELVDFAGRCADRGAGIQRANSKAIKLEIQRTAATAGDSAVAVGTYPFGKGGANEVTIERRQLTATCTSSGGTGLPFGTADLAVNALVITALDAKHVAGTYELTATDGRFVKGSFDASLCGAASPATTTCE